MTTKAIDQVYEQAVRGNVFAQALMGQILIEGKYGPIDRTNAIGWLRNAAKCNCLYAEELLSDELSKPFQPSANNDPSSPSQQIDSTDHDYMAELNRLIGLVVCKV